jgi:hypothetical protein
MLMQYELLFYPGRRKCTNKAEKLETIEAAMVLMFRESRMAVRLRIISSIITAAFCLATAAGQSPAPAEKLGSSYRHGYYLFLAGTPSGCEDCYVPLLLTRKTIEDLKESPTTEDCILITTYERDSIWHYDGLLRIAQSEINGAERKVRIFNKTYRYQEIAPPEVLRLLQNPSGKISISRVYLQAKLPAGPELKQLIADFQALK